MAGWGWLDAAAAIGVALMIGWIGAQQSWRAMRELVDTGLDPEELARFREIIGKVPGVASLHMLKTRRMGQGVLVEVHIILADARASVSEGHQISETVRAALMRSEKRIIEVTVHIDPEDDEVVTPNRGLPLREDMLELLRSAWSDIPASGQIRDVTLHYLDGSVHVDVVFPLDVMAEMGSPEELSRRLRRAVADDPRVGEVSVLFR
jgi:divalent metal cation (Fe/Co/Zn/Cd) transporter